MADLLEKQYKDQFNASTHRLISKTPDGIVKNDIIIILSVRLNQSAEIE